MVKLTSRERLLKTFRGEKVDRIPISLYEFDGHYKSWIENYPEYVKILKYAEDKTDKLYAWSPDSEANVVFKGKLDEKDIKTTTWQEGKSNFTKTVINTSLGELCSLYREEEGIHTVWEIEHFCKTEADAKKILSLPYYPWKPKIDSFFKLDKKLGDRGIILGEISDVLSSTVSAFGFTRFLTLYIENRNLVFKLLDFFQERLYNYLKHILENGAVTVYRIVGPEYATPPYLSPAEFDNFVTRYDKEIVKLLHQYGAWARLHSHGKIKQALKSLKEINIDAIDPIEPPPDGDVELKEARELLGNNVVLMGNVEERLFEIGKREEIEHQVRKAIEEGAKDGPFILCPTSMPLTTPLDKKIQENIIYYIDCGIKYGSLS